MSVRTAARANPALRRHRPIAPLLLLVVLAALVALAGTSSTASAQEDANTLQSIEPADASSLAESPTAITLVFNQELAADDTVTIQLTCSNQPATIGPPEIDADRIIVTAAIPQALPRGACVIAWSLKGADGDVIVASTSNFVVNADPPAVSADATATSGPTTGTTEPFERVPANPAAGDVTTNDSVDQGSTGGALWLGRVLSTIGILVVFGGLALISVGWPEGPEYVVTVRFLRAAWLVSLLGTVLFLVAYSADFNGTSLGTAMSPGEWLDLNDAGWEGRGALLRFVFIAASGWVAMRPERIIDPQSAMWAWAIPGFALVSVALGRVSGPVAPIGFAVGVAHVISVAVWFGGAALVARVVLAGPGEDDLVQATRTFSRISIPAILVACVTGIIQMIRLDGGDLFGSSHGRVLLLKTVAVAAMLAVSLAARQQVTMRLDRAHELTVPTADRFRRAFGAEAALGVVALAFSGWLLGLTPSKVDTFPSESYAWSLPFNDQNSGLQAEVSVGPSQVGLNGMTVAVEAPAEGITNLVIDFVPPEGSGENTIRQPIPLTTSGTAFLPTASGLPFRVGGTWEIKLSASTASGVLEEATSTFQVLDENGAQVTVSPVAPSSPAQVTIIDQSTTTAPFASTTTLPPPASSTSAPAG